jgi:hypothetical protein
LEPNETPVQPEPVQDPSGDPPTPRRRFQLNAKIIVFFLWLAFVLWGLHKISPLIMMFVHPESSQVEAVPAPGSARSGPGPKAKDGAISVPGHPYKKVQKTVPKVASRAVTNLPNEASYTYVNNTLVITVSTDRPQNVVITILDLNGHVVDDIFNGPWQVGRHSITWSGKNLAHEKVKPGNYMLVIQANQQTVSGVITVQDH